MAVRKLDRQKVLGLLTETGGNAAEAARRLGVHQNTTRAIARAAKGECVRCKQPVYPGRTMCQACLDSDRTRIREKRKARRSAGLCLECGAPRMDGSQFCAEHREMAMARSQRYETKMKSLRGAARGGSQNSVQKRGMLIAKYGPEAWRRWEHAGQRCEVCATPYSEVAIHLHHVDEDQSNNAFENFALLCFDCHRAVHHLLGSKDRTALVSWFERTYPDKPLR